MLRCIFVCVSTLLAGGAASAQDLSSLWPNADGNSWTYVQDHEDYVSPATVLNTVRLYFDGTVLVPDGPVVQDLREEEVQGAQKFGNVWAETAIQDPFLRQLWRARPDLRAAIEAKAAGSVVRDRQPLLLTVLMTAAAFEKTPDAIRAWRTNASNLVSWIWLVSDLTPGHQFQLQLVPDFADDVFLYGTLGAVEKVIVPAGAFDAQRVDYRIDYGEASCTDESGLEVGTFRSETIGFIHYAPGVGPVQVSEDLILGTEVTGNCMLTGEVTTRTTLDLLNTQVVGVEVKSWSSVKEGYRAGSR